MTKEQKILKEFQALRLSGMTYLVVLRELSDRQVHTPTALAKATFTHTANMTGLLDTLEGAGLVLRVKANDRRKMPVLLSDKGVELWNRISSYEDDQAKPHLAGQTVVPA